MGGGGPGAGGVPACGYVDKSPLHIARPPARRARNWPLFRLSAATTPPALQAPHRRDKPRPACVHPTPSGGALRCTTQRHNAHGTGTGTGFSEEREVVYPWHPWAGRFVRVHNVIRRPTGAIARCTVVDGETAVRALEIPVWMLDAVWCRDMRHRTEPVASVDALKAWVFRNSCGRTSHEDRRVEIEAAENAEPGVAADGVPQQDAAEESTTTLAAARFTVPDS